MSHEVGEEKYYKLREQQEQTSSSESSRACIKNSRRAWAGWRRFMELEVNSEA